ncbi:olfactory receptor 1019-like [Bombina bombina]|uniref:olfactory receptor 1019-like n=1 Tax=Bombina bombina TaxID=8345 RepID=UPI00235AB4C9|nr:olfactory receptor 1019-like [Bombina bombina]
MWISQTQIEFSPVYVTAGFLYYLLFFRNRESSVTSEFGSTRHTKKILRTSCGINRYNISFWELNFIRLFALFLEPQLKGTCSVFECTLLILFPFNKIDCKNLVEICPALFELAPTTKPVAMRKPFLNETSMSEFLILGFSITDELRVHLFLFFLLIYLLTMLNNLLIITLVLYDSRLQTPMYFFLCNLSFLDIFYTSVTAPKLLYITLTSNKIISFRACMTQLFFFNSFGSTEYLLLTSMSYDRYVAICKPLFYNLLMNRHVCQILVGAAWVAGLLAAMPISVFISDLQYCSSNHINHFFCDLTPLLSLACNDTFPVQIIIFSEGVLIVMNCFLLTITSYIHIISAILKIPSREGRHKTFSTCASHLTVVSLFYIMITCMYMKPASSYSLNDGKVISVLYVNIIPLLNPLIYSLRNKDVKAAINKLFA